MSNINEEDIAEWQEKKLILPNKGDLRLDEKRGWLKYEGDDKWLPIPIADVDRTTLLDKWEDLVYELSIKQTELNKLKEEYTRKEFDIVFKSDIDFKALYGSTSEKVRKQHASEVLSDLGKAKESLELSIEFIKNYIPLIREVVRTKE